MAKKSISPRKLVDRSVPSGLESCWKLWRFCLCRNGFYPLVVAPFVTAAWLLDLYGTMGCNSLHLDVGMEPLNTAWNKTSMDLGLFHFRSDEMNEMGQNHDFLMSALHPECHRYDALFNEYFIDGDKTWKMSQYMAYISGSAGCIATVTIWMMIITPLPSCFFWPGILLPSSLVMLLAGGAKFLFFDTEICRSALWLPSEGDPKPQKAEGCHLSDDSIINIITCVLSFACVLLICLKAPTRRMLDQNFGSQYSDVDNDMQGLRVDTMEDSTCDSMGQYDAESQKERTWSPVNADPSRKKAYDLEDIVDPSMKSGGNEIVSTGVDTSSRFTLSKRSKRSGKTAQSTWESEELRVVEPSVEYEEKDLSNMMSSHRKWKENANEDTYDNENEAISHPSGGKYSTPAFAGSSSQHSGMKFVSPTAPSDEGNFFRSPLKVFKDNFSPQKMKKVDPPPIKTTKQYDDNIIQNCLNDLERSFSE